MVASQHSFSTAWSYVNNIDAKPKAFNQLCAFAILSPDTDSMWGMLFVSGVSLHSPS